MKKLHRSSRDKLLFGVCGGLSEYLGVSPALVRVVVLVLAFVGSGIVLYIAGMIVMPPDPGDARETGATPAPPAPRSAAATISLGFGALLVIMGVVLLLDRLDFLDAHAVWLMMRNVVVPVAIILFGVAVLMRRHRSAGIVEPAAAAPVPLEQAPLRGGQWFRARTDRKLFGVCAGIAHAMNIDPTAVRLAWVLLSLHSLGLGFVVYLILALVLPEEPVA